MASANIYNEAHLVAAAIRILEHQKKTPPSIDDVCDLLDFSLEHGNRILRKLLEVEAVKSVEGVHGARLFIADYLKIENIPKEETGGKLGEELKKFQESQKGISKKIESIAAQQAEKKKNLFAELEKQLKKNKTEKQ